MVSPVTTVVAPWSRIVLGLFLVVTPVVSWITPHSLVHRSHTTTVATRADTGYSLISSSSPVRLGCGLQHRTQKRKEFRLFSASYSNDNMPDEASLRRAYDSWRDFYSNPNLRTSVARTVSPEFDSMKFQHFKDNFVALKQANYKAWLKATSNNQVPPPPLQLNEFGDCSAEEYQRIVNGGSSSSSRSTTSTTPSTSTWSSYNNNNKQNAPIPTQVNSKTLTPPPTATPWAASTGGTSTSSTATTTYNDSENVNNNSYNNNNYKPNSHLNKMDPSTSYQVQSDGTYSYVPLRNQNMDDTKPIPRSRAEDARSPYGTVGGYPTTSSTSTDPASVSAYNGGGGSGAGSVSSYSGMYGAARDQGPPSPMGPMGEWNSGPTYPGSVGGTSSSSSVPFPFNGDPYGVPTTSTNGATGYMDSSSYVGGGAGMGGPFDNGSSSSSSYWSTSSSRGPPSPSSTNGEGRNGYNGYDTVAGGATSGPLYGDPTINGSGGYGGIGGYPNGASPPPSSPPPPILTPDEQAALDRARSRHEMIPKAVFDEDESEDENTDNSWANFGMPKAKKIRREKMDLPPPIINGVGNGGMIGVGPNMGNRPSTSFGTSINNMKSNPSSSQVVGNSYSDIRKVGTNTNVGASNTNAYLQDRIRDAYQDWCNNHGKPFEEYRLPIFQKNYLEMEKYSQETGIPLQQLNKYADLSPEEFKAVKTPPSRHNNRNNNDDMPDWIQETPESKLESKEEFLNVGPRWGNEPPKGTASPDIGGTRMMDPITGATRDYQGELRLRMAYQEWCQQNNKVFDENRLPIFSSNLVAMEQYCLTQNMPMKPLNAYADLSPAEYQVAIAAEKERPRFGDSTATMSSFLGGNGGGTMASSMPQRMPPGMGVMAPPPYDIGRGPPEMGGMYGGGPYRDEPPQPPPSSQFYDAGLGYGSAMAPGGTNSGSSMPASGQGGTIPPVNIATSGRTTTTAATERATVAGGATPSSEPRRTKPTEAEFKRNAEARLKAFTEAKNRRRGDGDARVKKFAELKKQVALVAKEQNVTIEEATQLVFANATMSPASETVSPLPLTESTANVTLAATNIKGAASNGTIPQHSATALQAEDEVDDDEDDDDDFDEDESNLDDNVGEDVTEVVIADASMSMASKIVSPLPLTESTANVTLSATNVKEAATNEMIPQNYATTLQREDEVDDDEDNVDDLDEDKVDVDEDNDAILEDALTTKSLLSTYENVTKGTSEVVETIEIPTNAMSNVTIEAAVELMEIPTNDTTNVAAAAAVEKTEISTNAIQEQVQVDQQDLAPVDVVTDAIQKQVETEQPSSKHRAVVDLSDVLSIEKNFIQTESPKRKKEPKKSKGEKKKETVNGSNGSRSHVHAETKHQPSVGEKESVAGSGGDAKESDQLKRAEAAKNKYSAQKASLDSDSGTDESLPSDNLSSPKEVIDAKSPPPEYGDIIGEKEALSTPSSSFLKSNLSANTESDTDRLGEDDDEVEIATVTAVTPVTISDQDEVPQKKELLIDSASMKHQNDTSDSSVNAESVTSTSRETVEVALARVSAVMPATISDQDKTSQATELMVEAASTKDANDTSLSRAESPDSVLDERTKEEAKLKAEMEVIQEKLKVFEIARKKAEAEAKEKSAEASRLREAMKAKHLAAQLAQEKSEAEKVDNKKNKQVSDEGSLETSKEAQAEKDLFKKFASDVSSMFRDLQK